MDGGRRMFGTLGVPDPARSLFFDLAAELLDRS